MSESESEISTGRCLPSRQPYWSELSDADKLERCRLIIKRLERTVDSMAMALTAMEVQFRRHHHTKSGTPMVDIPQNAAGSDFHRNGVRRNDEQYF